MHRHVLHSRSMARCVSHAGRVGAVISLIVLVALAGCGGEGPTEPVDEIQVNPSAPVLASLTDSIVLTATRSGQPVSSLTLSLSRETRDVGLLPVLQPAALQRGVLKPAGPGTVILNVSSPAGSARVTVRVAVPGAAVFGAVATAHPVGADTLTLLGSGLEAVPLQGAVQVGGQPVTLVYRDANRLRFVTPVIAVEGCEGPALRLPVAVAGASVVEGLRVAVTRADEIRLRTGDFRMLSATEAACIRLPAAGAEYVLAYADMEQETRGRTGWAGFGGTPYGVRLVDRTTAAAGVGGDAAKVVPARALIPGRAAAMPAHIELSDAPAAATDCSDDDFVDLTFWCRSKPWTVGETMTIRKPGSVEKVAVGATVWKTFGNGRFVFAVMDGEESQALRDFKAGIEAAMPHVVSTSMPLFESMFGSSEPNTSEGSGQLLTIIGDFQHSSVGAGCCTGGAPWAAVVLGSWHIPWEPQVFYLLTHEFAHTWQMRWFYDHRPEGGDVWPSVTWGNEGGADLVAYEAQRRYAQLPWRANMGLMEFGDGADRRNPLQQELAAAGDFALGYVDASSFMRDVVARMVESGVPPDDAFMALTLGSLEDWHGWDFQGRKRPGFVERVQAFVPGWDVGDALLVYALSQAADDLTTATTLQNPFYRLAGTEPLGDGFGTRRVETGTGEEIVFARMATSLGVVWLEDGGEGGSIEVTTDRPEVRWAIARVR